MPAQFWIALRAAIALTDTYMLEDFRLISLI